MHAHLENLLQPRGPRWLAPLVRILARLLVRRVWLCRVYEQGGFEQRSPYVTSCVVHEAGGSLAEMKGLSGCPTPAEYRTARETIELDTGLTPVRTRYDGGQGRRKVWN